MPSQDTAIEPSLLGADAMATAQDGVVCASAHVHVTLLFTGSGIEMSGILASDHTIQLYCTKDF